MATVQGTIPYQEITNSTGRVFRVGEQPRQLLGYSRVVVIISAWVAMMLAGLLEYTWGALNPSTTARSTPSRRSAAASPAAWPRGS